MKKLRLPSIALGLALLAPAAARAEEVPWYDRPSCQQANDLFLSLEAEKADEAARRLEASKDLDDLACALWIRVSFSEFQVGLFGKTPENLSQRKKVLTRLFGFSKANKAKGPRFADLELEARLRRTRILNEEGQRTQALDELKQLQKLVSERDPALPPTPPLLYTKGVMNAALSSPGWAARTVLSIAGLNVDPAVGAEHLHKLVDGSSVYRGDAAYVSHFFGEEIGEKYFRAPASYTRIIAEKYPTNPQFSYERATDLLAEKKPAEALAQVAPVALRIDASPGLWSPPLRAKILYATARCLAATGKKDEAKKRALAAKAERYGELADKISDLIDELE